MRYYKQIENGYIALIGEDCGGIEISKDEYDAIMNVIKSKPETTDTQDYLLKENLEWELYELPPVVEDLEEQENTWNL